MNLKEIVRKNVLELLPYSCARDEFKGEASIYLDANESPYNLPFNRYPDPLQIELKRKISEVKNVAVENMFLGNGSDEAIDLIYRIFCEPKVDNVVAIEPTYGMYKVCASINDVAYQKVLLDDLFGLNADNILKKTDKNTKVIWLCSPNNPTGNLLCNAEIIKILNAFRGVVVIDEAYIDFSANGSWLQYLNKFPSLIVLQTFSKAWGNAAIRLGMAFASVEIIHYFNKVKYPYNINLLTQQHALKALENHCEVNNRVSQILKEKEKLATQLSNLAIVKRVYPSDANFLLVKVINANATYQTLVKCGIIVRNRNSVSLCEGCLRITVGTPQENETLIKELNRL